MTTVPTELGTPSPAHGGVWGNRIEFTGQNGVLNKKLNWVTDQLPPTRQVHVIGVQDTPVCQFWYTRGLGT